MTEALGDGGPLVSLLIPTRNRPALAEATIGAALANSPEWCEVVVAENSDAGRRLMPLEHPRLRLLPSPTVPLTMSDNWERAVEAARGDWILVLSDKFHLVPGALHRLEQILRAAPRPVIVYGMARLTQALPDDGRASAQALACTRGRLEYTRPAGPSHLQWGEFEPLRRAWFESCAYVATDPMLYTALVRRRTLDAVRRRASRIFLGPAPDIASGLQIALEVPSYLRVHLPLVLRQQPSVSQVSWSAGVAVALGTPEGRAFLRSAGAARDLPPTLASVVFETTQAVVAARRDPAPGSHPRRWRQLAAGSARQLLDNHPFGEALEEAARLIARVGGSTALPFVLLGLTEGVVVVALRPIRARTDQVARSVLGAFGLRQGLRRLRRTDGAPHMVEVEGVDVAAALTTLGVEWERHAGVLTDGTASARVSIIIPTYNRQQALLDALETVARCDPAPLEVIVVDQSDVSLVGVPTTLAGGCPVRLVRLRPPNAQVARNLGARLARGDVLLYLDDDVLVEPGLIGAHANAYRDPTVGAVAGYYKEPGEGDVEVLPHRVSGTATGWLYFPHSYVGRCDTRSLPTCNGSIRRSLLFSAGGFDENFIRTHFDDADLSVRLRALGARILHEPSARLLHLKVPAGGNRPSRLDETILADRHAWQVWIYFFWLNFGVQGLPELARRLRGTVVRRTNVVRPWRLARGLVEVGAGLSLAARAIFGGRKLPLRRDEPRPSVNPHRESVGSKS